MKKEQKTASGKGPSSARSATKKGPSSAANATKEAACNCGGDFDAESAFRTLARDIARLADLGVGAGAARSATRSVTAAPASTTRGTRSLTGSVAGAAGVPEYLQILRESRAAMENEPASASEIVGGRPTREFPSCCCIGDEVNNYYCSAVLVRPRVVLTAAHCGATISKVFIAGWDVKALHRGEVIGVTAVVRHPRYNEEPNANDITVILLDKPAATKPVELANAAEINKMKTCEVVGFGNNDRNRPLGFGTKRRVSVPVAAIRRKASDDLTEASTQLGFNPDFELVAGRKFLGLDSCNGDSGGPVYLVTAKGPRLVGLTSRATAEAEENCGDGGIYVRPDKHDAWIRSVVEAHGLTW